MITIRNKQRFDDVGELDADGFYDYVYRGYNYEIAADERVFYVRTYDDEPGVAIVVKPTTARTCSEARQLVEFLIATLGCTGIKFSAPDGGYRRIDIRTLEFAPHEPDAAQLVLGSPLRMTTETPQLEFVTTRSRAEVWWVWLKSSLLRPTFLLGCVVALVAGLYFTVKGNEFYRGIGLFAFGCVLLAPFMYSLAIWRVVAKDPTVTAPTTVSIFSWGTRANSGLRSVSLTWDNFDSFVETRDLIILRLRNTKQFTIYPKRDLDSVQRATLVAILSQHLRGK